MVASELPNRPKLNHFAEDDDGGNEDGGGRTNVGDGCDDGTYDAEDGCGCDRGDGHDGW